jgi:hypothetical protein
MVTPIWPIEGVALDSTSDMVAGSLAAYVTHLYDANYTEGRCYPTLAAGATVESAAVNWTLAPAFWPVVPINTIASAYHVSAVVVETCDKNGAFELAIYYSAANTLMSTIRFSYIGGFWGNAVYLVPSVLIPANAQIDAKLAYSLGGGGKATITMSIIYRLT